MKFILNLIAAVLFSNTVDGQSKHAEKRIVIYGKIFDQKTKEPTGGANYLLKGTNLSGRADDSGNYEIDITKLADTAKLYVLDAKFINFELSEVILKGKIRNSIKVDLGLKEGDGNNKKTYKICGKKLKEIK